jgi:hypothetical protein
MARPRPASNDGPWRSIRLHTCAGVANVCHCAGWGATHHPGPFLSARRPTMTMTSTRAAVEVLRNEYTSR